MITIPGSTLISIIQAAQESNKKIVGVQIVSPKTTAFDNGHWGFAFEYKDSLTSAQG